MPRRDEDRDSELAWTSLRAGASRIFDLYLLGRGASAYISTPIVEKVSGE